jgi:type II secretory pathway pseudopilin PulG
MPHDEGEEGMMLTEVLVALAILSLLSIAMFRVFSETAQVVARVEASRQRLDLAENLLARLNDGAIPSTGGLSGETDGKLWRVDLVPVYEAAANGGASALSVRILVGDLSAPPVLTSVILAGQP